MSQDNTLNVELSKSQLNWLKSGIKWNWSNTWSESFIKFDTKL